MELPNAPVLHADYRSRANLREKVLDFVQCGGAKGDGKWTVCEMWLGSL